MKYTVQNVKGTSWLKFKKEIEHREKILNLIIFSFLVEFIWNFGVEYQFQSRIYYFDALYGIKIFLTGIVAVELMFVQNHN